MLNGLQVTADGGSYENLILAATAKKADKHGVASFFRKNTKKTKL